MPHLESPDQPDTFRSIQLEKPDQPIEDLAQLLQEAWKKYVEVFGVAPHGTLPQMRALVSITGLHRKVRLV